MAKPNHCVLNLDDTPTNTTQSAVELSRNLQKLMLRMKGEFMGDDGKGVDYDKLRVSDLFKEYKHQAACLQTCDLDTLSETERKAFCINIYNALTIHGLANEQNLPSSILDVQLFWQTVSYNVAGHVLSLNDIEHGILRANRPHPSSTDPQFSADDPRLKFVVENFDPRIHFALVCGAKSCPPINVYSATNLNQALDIATSNFCSNDVCLYTETDEIWLSMIFQWYGKDFGDNDVEVVRWTIPFLSETQKNRAHILLHQLESVGKVVIKYAPYNWSLNGK